MKRILFKTQQFPHLSETFVLSQIIMAIEEGYDVKILLQDLLDFEHSTHSKLLQKYEIREKIVIESYTIPKNKILRLIKALFILFKNIFVLPNLLGYIRLKTKFSLTWIYEFNFYRQFRRYDIIHVQYGTNVHPVDILKKTGSLNGRLIVSFHGHDAFFPINGFIQNNGYYDHLFWGDNIIVANTPYLAEKILRLGCKKENIITIPVPVDTDFFYPLDVKKNTGKCLKLITVGRLDPIKGHKVAIELMKRIIARNVEVDLTIVGEGQERIQLENQISALFLKNSVRLVGRKSQKEVRELLQISDIYLFTGVPVREGRRETQGLATLEAQACGLPVLVCDSGGVKYTLVNGKTGYMCQENDLDCLEKNLFILTNPELRRTMGKGGREFVKLNFSLDVIRKRWREIYEAKH